MFPPQASRAMSWEEIPAEVDVVDDVLVRLANEELRRYVRRLPEPYRTVVTLRFGLVAPPLTRRQVGECLHLSPASIRRIERQGLTRLRRAYACGPLLAVNR